MGGSDRHMLMLMRLTGATLRTGVMPALNACATAHTTPPPHPSGASEAKLVGVWDRMHACGADVREHSCLRKMYLLGASPLALTHGLVCA